MTDINRVVLVGRLTRDSELKYTNGGLAIAKFSLANGYSKKVGDNWENQTNFIDCVMIGKRAEGLNGYLTKGTQIAVDGELRQNRWEQDGQKRSKVEIMANNIQLLGGKPQEKSSGAENVKAVFEDDVPF